MKSSIHLFYGIIIGILISLISGCGGAYAEKKKQERERTGKRSKLEWFIDRLVLPSAEFYDLEKDPDTHFEQWFSVLLQSFPQPIKHRNDQQLISDPITPPTSNMRPIWLPMSLFQGRGFNMSLNMIPPNCIAYSLFCDKMAHGVWGYLGRYFR